MRMDFVTGLVVFQMIWWVVLFMVLPFGVRPTLKKAPPGSEPGAPRRPRLLFKLLITTLISVVLFGIVFGVMEAGWIRLRPTAEDLCAWEGAECPPTRP